MKPGNQSEGGFGLMLPNILLLLAVSTGIYVSEPPLTSVRYRAESSEEVGLPDRNTARTRLWEDPLSRLPNEFEAGESEALHSLVEIDSPQMLLFVGLPGGAGFDAREKRIRTRMAVISAISGKCGFQPTREGKIKVGWLGEDLDSRLPTAYESFRATLAYQSKSWATDYDEGLVGVVYFDTSQPELEGKDGLVKIIREAEGCFADPHEFPWEKYGMFPHDDDKSVKKGRDRVAIALNRSQELRGFIRDIPLYSNLLGQFGEVSSPSKVREDGELVVYSPRVTISNQCLKRDFEVSQNWGRQVLLNAVHSGMFEMGEGEANGYQFQARNGEKMLVKRVGPNDMGASKALLYELKNRGVVVSDDIEDLVGQEGKVLDDEERTRGNQDAILLLSELDTIYGRYLPISFRRARWDTDDRVARMDSNRERLIRVMQYPLALDGLQATKGKEEGGEGEEGKLPSHVAEGPAQFDALRRLPARLKELERSDRVRYRAIGLMGSDVHDKIMMLSALKPHFPEAVFFTTDLDARLWQGDGREVTRNLLVASGFGLNLSEDLQGNVLPFRSNYQTATYASCLDAMGFRKAREVDSAKDGVGEIEKRSQTQALLESRAVRLYEIGRRGPVALGIWDPKHEKSSDGWENLEGKGGDKLATLELRSRLSGGGSLLIGLLFIVWAGLCVRRSFDRPDGDILKKDRKRWRDSLFLASSFLLCLSGLYLTLRLWLGVAISEEPVVFNEAVSVWGLVLSNLCLILVAIWLLRTAMDRLDRNWKLVNQDYPFNWFSRSDESKAEDLSEPIDGEFTAGNRKSYEKLSFPSAFDPKGWLLWVRNWLSAGSGWSLKLPRGLRDSERLEAAVGGQRRRVEESMGVDALSCSLGRAYGREGFCGEQRNRWIRVGVLLFFFSTAFMLVDRNNNASEAPSMVRGEDSRFWYEFTDMPAQAALIICAMFAADAQMLMLIALGKFRRFLLLGNRKSTGPSDVDHPYPFLNRPELGLQGRRDRRLAGGAAQEGQFDRNLEDEGHPTTSRGLWELPLLRAAARRSQVTAGLIYIPFSLLFLVVLSRYPFFEGLSPTETEKWLYGVVLIAPLILGGCVQVSMASIFRRTKRRIEDGRRRYLEQKGFGEEDGSNPFLRVFDRDLSELEELRAKTMYTLFGNPLFKAILLPISGAGILQLVQVITPLLK